MKYLLLFSLLIGCTLEKNYKEDIKFYRCSSKQLEQVIEEQKVCDKTSYYSDYCFKQAKLSQCEYIGPKTRKRQNYEL